MRQMYEYGAMRSYLANALDQMKSPNNTVLQANTHIWSQGTSQDSCIRYTMNTYKTTRHTDNMYIWT